MILHKNCLLKYTRISKHLDLQDLQLYKVQNNNFKEIELSRTTAGEVLMWCEGKTCSEVEDAPLIEVEKEIREEEDSGSLPFLSAASSVRCGKI